MEQLATEEELEVARQALQEGEDWIYDEGDSAELSAYAAKRADIERRVAAIKTRFEEFQKRPEALDGLRRRIESANTKANEWASSRPQIPAEELRKLAALASQTLQWME